MIDQLIVAGLAVVALIAVAGTVTRHLRPAPRAATSSSLAVRLLLQLEACP